MLPGIAEVCNISTSKTWQESPSRDTGRSGPIAEGDDDDIRILIVIEIVIE